MTYLLDTHVMLWALTEPTRLGPTARDVIENRSSRLVVSAVSAWEITTKHRLGAIRLSVTEDHALLAGRLDWKHRDPFDRMLAAQAMIESLVIITGDPAFAGCPGVPTLW